MVSFCLSIGLSIDLSIGLRCTHKLLGVHRVSLCLSCGFRISHRLLGARPAFYESA